MSNPEQLGPEECWPPALRGAEDTQLMPYFYEVESRERLSAYVVLRQQLQDLRKRADSHGQAESFYQTSVKGHGRRVLITDEQTLEFGNATRIIINNELTVGTHNLVEVVDILLPDQFNIIALTRKHRTTMSEDRSEGPYVWEMDGAVHISQGFDYSQNLPTNAHRSYLEVFERREIARYASEVLQQLPYDAFKPGVTLRPR